MFERNRCAPAWVLTLLLAGPTQAADAPSVLTRTWNFEARLDGKPIGEHRFVVTEDGTRRVVTNTASFDVKMLGFSVYRYMYQATERWEGDCLQSMVANTDDDGKTIRVRAQREGDTLRVQGGKTEVDASGCLMSYAYWHPGLRQQTRLVNSQTGAIDAVTVSSLGPGTIEVGTTRVSAQRFRIQAPPGPLDVWTTPQGEWIGLDATLSHGRRLSYRLKSPPVVTNVPAGGGTAVSSDVTNATAGAKKS
jgi:hypothetical protein